MYFVGITSGSQLTNIPTPTQPISPVDGNLYVDPTQFAINMFTPLMQSLQIGGQNVTQSVDLPIVFGGPDLNTRRLNLELNAIDSQLNEQKISRPTVMVNENESAKFFLGQSLPYYFYWIKSSKDSVTTANTIIYEDLGTLIEVKGSIKKRDIVSLDLYVQFMEITSGSISYSSSLINPNPPRLSFIKLKSNIEIQDGRTMLVAGNFNYQDDNIINIVPGISKIKIVGNLFKGTARQSAKQKKFIFLTAKIIND